MTLCHRAIGATAALWAFLNSVVFSRVLAVGAFDAPPISFEAGGKQYVAILSGLSNITKRRHDLTPELREMRNQTMLFVFGL